MKKFLGKGVSFAIAVCIGAQVFVGFAFMGMAAHAKSESMTVRDAKASFPSGEGALIAGIVWVDENGNGLMDANERVLPGVQILLLGAPVMPSPIPTPEETIDPSPEVSGETEEPAETPGEPADTEPSPAVVTTPTQTSVPTPEPTPEPTPQPTPESKSEAMPESEASKEKRHSQKTSEPVVKTVEESVEPAAEPAIVEISTEETPLSDGSDLTFQSAVSTGADGWYIFKDVIPGEYQLVIQLPQGMKLTKSASGDSAFGPASLKTSTFMVAENQHADTLHAGVGSGDIAVAKETELPQESAGMIRLALECALDQEVYQIGDMLCAAVTLSNFGTADATNIIVGAGLDETTAFDHATAAAGEYDSARQQWRIDVLPKGETKKLMLYGKASENTKAVRAFIVSCDQASEDLFSVAAEAHVNIQTENASDATLLTQHEVRFVDAAGNPIGEALYVNDGESAVEIAPEAPLLDEGDFAAWECAEGISLECITADAAFLPVYMPNQQLEADFARQIPERLPEGYASSTLENGETVYTYGGTAASQNSVFGTPKGGELGFYAADAAGAVVVPFALVHKPVYPFVYITLNPNQIPDGLSPIEAAAGDMLQ